ncbi:MAG: HAD family hydrolase [Phycisphaerae bacterium]
MGRGRFDAVLIDFYGTLSAGDGDAVDATCRRLTATLPLSITPRELAVSWGERFFDIIGRSNRRSFKTLFECELLSLERTLASLGINGASCASFISDLENYWRDPPLHPDALKFLRAIDLPLCCVSNADTAALMSAIERNNLPLRDVTTSEAARCYKPAPAIFLRALETVGVQPHRAVHIGDSLHSDISGAARLGIATVWIRREGRIHDIGTCRPDHTVSSLTEVLPLLT